MLSFLMLTKHPRICPSLVLHLGSVRIRPFLAVIIEKKLRKSSGLQSVSHSSLGAAAAKQPREVQRLSKAPSVRQGAMALVRAVFQENLVLTNIAEFLGDDFTVAHLVQVDYTMISFHRILLFRIEEAWIRIQDNNLDVQIAVADAIRDRLEYDSGMQM